MARNPNPGELLKLSGIYWQTCTLHAAVKLDIFTAIGEETLTARALADKMVAPERSLTMLLNALCAMNLLKKEPVHSNSAENDADFTYNNSHTASEFLSQSSPRYIGFIIIIHDFILNNAKDAPLFPTLFSLNMLLVTGDGQAYSEQEITRMLSQSSFTGIQRLSFIGPNDSGLITGILPQ